MTVIKQKQAERLTQSAVVLDLGDLKRQGAAIIARAKAQAQRLLDDAEQEAGRIIESAGEIGESRGYDEGLKRGLSEGRDQGCERAKQERGQAIQQMIARWGAALDAWESARRDMLLEAKEDVIALAIALAERVTHRQIEAQPELVADQMAEALTLVSRRSEATVRVHPEDRALIETILPDIISRIDTCSHVKLEDDAAIERGGCVVSTDGGQIDATISTQLDRIAETLLPGRRNRLAPQEPGDDGDGDGTRA